MKFNNFFISLIPFLLFITIIFADINDRDGLDERDEWYNNYGSALYPNNFHRKRDGGNRKRDLPTFLNYKRDASPKANFYYYKLQKSSNESNKQDEEDNEQNGENESESNNQKR
ncbi:3374_t:CDS:2, partial [Dentiscutata heterogama]